MSLVVESYSSASATNAASVTVTKPTGVATGDLLLIITNAGATGVATCTGFTEIYSAYYDGPGLISDAYLKVLAKIADSGDVSASNYTINGSTNQEGISAMMRISGFTSGNPIFSSNFAGFAPTVSGTFEQTGLSLKRVSQQLLLMIGLSYDGSESDYIGDYTSPTVTSSDANPSWTTVCNIKDVSIQSSNGKKSLFVAYASTTNTSNITAFSYGFTEFDADDRCGAIGALLVLNEPVNVTPDVSHLNAEPTIFAPTVTQVNIALDISHINIEPTVNSLETKDSSENAVWTTITKS